MKQYNKKNLLLCMAVALLIPCHGQNKEYDREKSVITDVKRNPSKYVYAEATCKTEEEAKAVAEEMFLENINEYVNSVKQLRAADDIVLNDQKGFQHVIAMPRGTNMHRVFLYVKKSDIIAMKNPIVLTNSEKTSDVLESTITTIGEDSLVSGDGVPQPIKDIACMNSVQQLNQYLKSMKLKGRKISCEKYNNLPIKSEWYLVVYDANGIIKAVLSDGDERLNITTNEPDSEKNYPSHAALGIRIEK